MPDYFKENLPVNIAKLKSKLETCASFVTTLLNTSSPAKIGGTKHSISKTEDDLFDKTLEHEVPKFWSFP